jgi:hypothetical protein
MASTNRPDKFTLDAYSDFDLKNLPNNGVYSTFTNHLATPILGAKSIQVLNVNFVNSMLQLNDYSLMFFYVYGAGAGSFRCVRLHPASFVPFPGFTSFVKNRYFNDMDELVIALNLAATAGGDSATFNTLFEANTISFAFDDATRRITISSPGGANIAPVAADDPRVLAVMNASNTQLMMNGFTGNNLIGGATYQPRRSGFSMNSRLGFAMSYNTRGLWWNGNSVVGNACATGVRAVSVEADANPIFIGTQNVGVYLDIATGGGYDSKNRKNLAANIPCEVAPLNVNSYTLSSVQAPLLSCPNEIYEITATLLDENGFPFPQPPNYNCQIAVSVFY